MYRRIRIFFIGCPTLDVDAASQLLLSQNAVQNAVQFEIYHFWIFSQKACGIPRGWRNRISFWYADTALPFSKAVGARNRVILDRRDAPLFRAALPQGKWFGICKEVLHKFDEWLQCSESMYDVSDCPSIIITEAPIEGGFISNTRENIGLVSTAKWSTYFRPVSALDYILFSVQRLTMRLVFTQEVGSHYPTRGCLWDYDDHQPDARIAVLLGHICGTCKKKLLDAVGASTYEQVSLLVSNKWLGDKSVQFTPAAVLANVYKYDLSRSTGLSASFISRIIDSLPSELGKILSEAIKWAIVLIITLTLAAYFPSVLNKIRNQLDPAGAAASTSSEGALSRQSSTFGGDGLVPL
jgi:hypothetical protein